jgi:tRNA (guanine-N7-)-methyltransferase
METLLPPNWPNCNYNDCTLPLFVDIGCGKGGFLLDLAGKHRGISRNYGDGLFNDDDADEEETNMSTIQSNINNEDIIQHPTTPSTTTTTKLWPLPPTMNYLGLEIRPGVSQYAQSRVSKHGLDGYVSYVGCNANIDLDRLLTLYANNSGGGSNDINNNSNNAQNQIKPMVTFASIQFPDPHFKIRHAKRRIVTTDLVTTLAKFVMVGGGVFLQSDVKEALEAMREKFVEDYVDNDCGGHIGPGKKYFDEWSFDNNEQLGVVVEEGEGKEYRMENPLGVPTEREGSVLVRGLPVYRTLFKRNAIAFDEVYSFER